MSGHSPRFRTLIVDDEALARNTLRLLLRKDPEIEIVAECASGKEAVRAIREWKPDVIFLDIQMPEVNGFEVLRQTGVNSVAAVVFVTAYDQYAVRAFEVHALDYVLKPFDDERFAKALERAKLHVRQGKVSQLGRQLAALLEYDGSHAAAERTADQPTEPGYLQRIAVKSGGRIYFLKVGEIDWIGAADQYVEIHVGPRSHLIRESISRMESELDPAKFFRIHRSALVNLDRVKEVQPSAYGDALVVLTDGSKLRLSRSRREKLEEALTHQS